jgi:hypothetical protein
MLTNISPTEMLKSFSGVVQVIHQIVDDPIKKKDTKRAMNIEKHQLPHLRFSEPLSYNI